MLVRLPLDENHTALRLITLTPLLVKRLQLPFQHFVTSVFTRVLFQTRI